MSDIQVQVNFEGKVTGSSLPEDTTEARFAMRAGDD
jgi:hypothetical protein